MGGDKIKITTRLRVFIGGLGYRIFLWAHDMTQEEHFRLIRRDLEDKDN